jgi:hypothetical protein
VKFELCGKQNHPRVERPPKNRIALAEPWKDTLTISADESGR